MSSDAVKGPLPAAKSPARTRVVLDQAPRAVRVFDGTRAQLLARRALEAEERAFARGFANGESHARETAAGALARAAERLEIAAAAADENLGRDAVHVALEIARVLLKREIDAGRYDLERIVRETLQASGVGRGACVVHLNPADVARLEGLSFRSSTKIEPDPEVSPGDVHVTTQRGFLVRDIEAALASIAERLEGTVP